FQDVPLDEFKGVYAKYFAQDRIRGFDLKNGPLIRFHLIRQSEYQYYLIWTWHHILMDARPITSLFKDVFKQYDHDLPSSFKSKSSYREYIEWANDCDTDSHQQFWSSYLDGFMTKTVLPSKRKKQTGESYRHGEMVTNLSNKETKDLSDFATKNKVTLNTVCQAAWAILLSRHNESEDVLFATSKTTRAAAGIDGSDDCVGLCLATLPFRVKLTSDLKVSELLCNIQKDWVSLRPHEQSSLVDIAKWSSINGSGGLADSLCLFEGYKVEEELTKIDEYWQDRKYSLKETTNFKLALMGYGGKQLKLKICFNNIEYDDWFAQRLLSQLTTIFKGFIAGVEKVKDICLISKKESELLNAWNETRATFNEQQLVHDLITDNASITPNKVAVLCEKNALSYDELNQQANKLAGYLQTLDMGVGDRIGINMTRSTSMIVALLAVLKTGASYVPLDPSFPDDRLIYMSEDSGITVVLRSDNELHLFDNEKVKAINVNEIIASDNQYEFVSVQQTAEDIVYVLYTSGSTGKPKGVQICHKALLNFLISMSKKPGMGNEDKMLSVTTLSFDISGLEIYLPLIVGAEVLLATKDEGTDGRKLKQLIEQYTPTIMQATPATWRMLIDSGLDHCHGMKALCGGEALNKDLACALGGQVSELWNMYGPTETTIWSTIELISDNTESITVGKAIDNTQLYLLNNNMMKVPIGSSGDLYIGGVGVSSGYLNREDLNKEVFIEYQGRTIYKTGDLGSYHEDGQLECLGRSDNQVKIRGFRIELGEIEEVLTKHSDVSMAAVILDENGQDKRLVAYVEPNKENSIELENEILALAKKHLPKYMVPSAVILKEKLPLTPNNKIDRKHLGSLEVEFRNAGSNKNIIAPRTTDEDLMLRLWKEILNQENICINENFFELGDSLSAVTLLVRIENSFQIHLPLSALVENNTIAQLAVYTRSYTPENTSPITVLKEGLKDGKNIFCIPGAAGNALPLYDLAQSFDEKHTVLGFELNGYSNEDVFTVPELAELVFKFIIEKQKTGGYHLIGLCYGCLLSMVVAKKLKDSNREVLSMSFLDPPTIKVKKWLGLYLKIVAVHTKRIVNQGPIPLVKVLKKKLLGSPNPKAIKDLSSKKITDNVEAHFDVIRLKRISLSTGFVVPKYDGDIDIYYVRTSGITSSIMAQHSWDSVTNERRTTKTFINGGHGDFFRKPYSSKLAIDIQSKIESKLVG
ncbi:MAG: amino acid adenylation domain-containing protein, partial [Paraglaciecola sp.]